MTQPSLVERLRAKAWQSARYKSSRTPHDKHVCWEAAQAIERLEGEVARLKRQVILAVEGAQPLWSGEVAALRSQLDEAVGALEEVVAARKYERDFIAKHGEQPMLGRLHPAAFKAEAILQKIRGEGHD